MVQHCWAESFVLSEQEGGILIWHDSTRVTVRVSIAWEMDALVLASVASKCIYILHQPLDEMSSLQTHLFVQS